MNHARPKLKKCRTIFFDLEFYVPPESRKENQLNYNPWDKKCEFLGGSFLTIIPATESSLSSERAKKKIKSFWLWDYDSEKEILTAIYTFLKSHADVVRQAHNGTISPILCGIGITTSDIPVLMELFKRFKIQTNSEAFEFFSKFRVIDLSQLAIGVINNSTPFMYPVRKHVILAKYLNGKSMKPGESVWQLYESKDHDGIVQRVNEEVIASYIGYKKIKADFDLFKELEKENKIQTRLLNRNEKEEKG